MPGLKNEKKEPVAPQRCRRLVFMLRKAAIMKSLLACSVANVPLSLGFIPTKQNIVHYITSIICLALYPATSATT